MALLPSLPRYHQQILYAFLQPAVFFVLPSSTVTGVVVDHAGDGPRPPRSRTKLRSMPAVLEFLELGPFLSLTNGWIQLWLLVLITCRLSPLGSNIDNTHCTCRKRNCIPWLLRRSRTVVYAVIVVNLLLVSFRKIIYYLIMLTFYLSIYLSISLSPISCLAELNQDTRCMRPCERHPP